MPRQVILADDATFMDVKKAYFWELWVTHGNFADVARESDVPESTLRRYFHQWGWTKKLDPGADKFPVTIVRLPPETALTDPPAPSNRPAPPLTSREKLDAETQQLLKNRRPRGQ